jgi:hypothetical protein
MTIEQAKARLERDAEAINPYIKAFSRANWQEDFGEAGTVQTPLIKENGMLRVFRLRTDQFEKIQEKGREQIWFLLRPTLEKPVFIFQEQDDIVFVKSFRSKETTKILTLSVAKKSSNFEISSFHDAPFSKIKYFVQGCALLYPLKGLSGVTLQSPTQQSRHNAHTSSEGLERIHKNTTAIMQKQTMQSRLQRAIERDSSPEMQEKVRRAAVLLRLPVPKVVAQPISKNEYKAKSVFLLEIDEKIAKARLEVNEAKKQLNEEEKDIPSRAFRSWHEERLNVAKRDYSLAQLKLTELLSQRKKMIAYSKKSEMSLFGLKESEEYGAFGRIYREFYHDAAGAIAKLTEEQDGEAVAALYHPKVGDIDLVWGKAGDSRNTGYGLAKIVQYHPEILPTLQKTLLKMHIKQRLPSRNKSALGRAKKNMADDHI